MNRSQTFKCALNKNIKIKTSTWRVFNGNCISYAC